MSDETVAEMIERLGTDPLTWANEFQRIAERGADQDMVRWFAWAIEAGKRARVGGVEHG